MALLISAAVPSRLLHPSTTDAPFKRILPLRLRRLNRDRMESWGFLESWGFFSMWGEIGRRLFLMWSVIIDCTHPQTLLQNDLREINASYQRTGQHMLLGVLRSMLGD